MSEIEEVSNSSDLIVKFSKRKEAEISALT